MKFRVQLSALPPDPGPVFVQNVRLTDFLSFGARGGDLALRSLNLLIGPNGSGKSNLIGLVRALRAAPKEMGEVFREGGGVEEWIFKSSSGDACIGWDLVTSVKEELYHSISFRSLGHAFNIENERIGYLPSRSADTVPPFPERYESLAGKGALFNLAKKVLVPAGPIDSFRSILAQRRDPGLYPEITWLADQYERIRIYQEWTFGRKAVFREPQRADMRNDFLAEDFSNLGLYLNRLKTRFPAAKRQILDRLKDLYEGIEDFEVLIEGGSVQVFFIERDFSIPASRLSDGTLRYLCLLAILCDPEPPPLICIEEPELGLHPDILPKIAELLRSAATRTQLIVTTHSDILVDAMTETPEVVVVCSKVDGETRMERLDPVALKDWLEKYRLGELWTRGEIGGTRW